MNAAFCSSKKTRTVGKVTVVIAMKRITVSMKSIVSYSARLAIPVRCAQHVRKLTGCSTDYACRSSAEGAPACRGCGCA